MSFDILEIQPQELKFIFELKKQSSCSIRLVNKSNYHVAFKVKTTSPKKYCVRPNTGVIEPKSSCDFTVTMQAQRVAPPDLICKDKFLVQCSNVPADTKEEDITTLTFAKEEGKLVQERKLRVILVSPPTSPVLSPINGTTKQEQAYEAIEPASEAIEPMDQVVNENKKVSPPPKAIEDVHESKMPNYENLLVPKTEAESKMMKDVGGLKLVKAVDEMKFKLKELESKLSEAEVTIAKLKNEKRLTTQERESFRQELELERSKRGDVTVTRRVQVGFPLLFVCMVALISLVLGYRLHS